MLLFVRILYVPKIKQSEVQEKENIQGNINLKKTLKILSFLSSNLFGLLTALK